MANNDTNNSNGNQVAPNISSSLRLALAKAGEWGAAAKTVLTKAEKIKESFSELRELDDILTEISRTSDLTASELQKLGLSAYDTAGQYGKSAGDYLAAVKEMGRSGFQGKQATGMAEQSLLAQTAGNMDQELADNYILATNAAYEFNGAASKINDVLDGQYSIASRNNITLAAMAEAMNEAGAAASGYGVSVENLSAMIGTIEAAAGTGGLETGSGIKSILTNLQNTDSDTISNTLLKAGTSMTEIANGAEKLRNPIDILRDLADTFLQLEDSNPLRADILADIGGSGHEAQLAALLENMELYDTMLADYSGGSGSAMEEAKSSAASLTGALDALDNTWAKLLNTLVNAQQLAGGVNIFNALLGDVQKLASSSQALGTAIGTIGLTVLNQKQSGGLIRLAMPAINSPFLATVEFNSDVYDSCIIVI